MPSIERRIGNLWGRFFNMTYSNYKKYLEFESEHQKCYENLLNQYCSLSNSEDNHWAYNMVREVKLEKGIKIHLSAHVLNTESNRISVLKEAKNLSLLDFTNKDGVSRLMSERSILRDIEKENFSPKVFGDFYVKNSYFIEEEYIEGVPLINYKELQTNYSWFLNLIDNLELLNKKYNYTYRDLSFNNIIVSKEKKVYVIDFEHALSKTEFENEERVSLFGTPGFYETNLDLSEKQAEDILGIVYLLFWSQNLKEYRHFLNLDYIAAMKYIMTFEKDRYNKISSKERFYPIYKKAFNHEYRDFSELKSEFIQILEG